MDVEKILFASDSSLFKGKYAIIDSWRFMGSPFPMVSLVAAYLIFVYKIGPDYMMNRKPFKLTWIIRLYNIFQVVACIGFVYKFHQHGFSFRDTWKCVQNSMTDENLTKGRIETFDTFWWFLMLRFFEFIETVFFVLKKKQNQVSVLHVYHHISTAVLLWLFFKYSGGFMELFIVNINSCVHVVMYFYYFLSSFREASKIVRAMKPLITILQLTQLVGILGHCFVAVTPSCQASEFFYLQIPNISILILLFTQFYLQTYKRKRRSTKVE